MSDEHECPTCDKTFGSRQWVGRHYASEHEGTLSKFERQTVGGVECPVCGREYKSRQGTSVHCKAEHGMTLAEHERQQGSHECRADGCSFAADGHRALSAHESQMHDLDAAETGVYIECAWCGGGEYYPWAQRHRMYCSQSCAAKDTYADSGISGSGVEVYPERVEVECKTCGGTKEIWPSRADSTERNFCDEDCRDIWLSRCRTGEQNPNWSGGRVLKVECAVCGAELIRRDTGQSVYYCRPNCEGAWKSENATGQDSPTWKGGYTMLSAVKRQLHESWAVAKEKMRLVNTECRMCGVSVEENGQELDQHHIVPVRAGGMNGQWNLMSLCRSCHGRVESFTAQFTDPHLVDWTDDELPDGRERWTPDAEPSEQADLAAFADD